MPKMFYEIDPSKGLNSGKLQPCQQTLDHNESGKHVILLGTATITAAISFKANATVVQWRKFLCKF
jgi:hypothetical protein